MLAVTGEGEGEGEGEGAGDAALAAAAWAAAVTPSEAPFQTVPIDTVCSRFCLPYQRFTKPRENTTAENMLVKMPMQCTTANPRTGPEPKMSSARPAIKVVTLESRIVAQAFS